MLQVHKEEPGRWSFPGISFIFPLERLSTWSGGLQIFIEDSEIPKTPRPIGQTSPILAGLHQANVLLLRKKISRRSTSLRYLHLSEKSKVTAMLHIYMSYPLEVCSLFPDVYLSLWALLLSADRRKVLEGLQAHLADVKNLRIHSLATSIGPFYYYYYYYCWSKMWVLIFSHFEWENEAQVMSLTLEFVQAPPVFPLPAFWSKKDNGWGVVFLLICCQIIQARELIDIISMISTQK